jgi:hypothetical protein
VKREILIDSAALNSRHPLRDIISKEKPLNRKLFHLARSLAK